MIITAPDVLQFRENDFCVFLGGTIDNGSSDDWQKVACDELERRCPGIVLFNPRRPEWKQTTDQTTNNPDLVMQINWELDALTVADVILMYLAPGSASPISLLELGLFLRSGSKLVVCCPDGFYRQANVDITCQRSGVPVHRTLDAALDAVLKRGGAR